MEEFIDEIYEDEDEFLEFYREIAAEDIPLDFFTEAFSDSETWEEFLDILNEAEVEEASNISVAKRHGVTTAKKYKKLKDRFKGNKNVTISVDKSGKVSKKKKDKQKARKMARVLKRNRKGKQSKTKRSTKKTERSSLYKRLNKEEITMEDLITYDPSEDTSALFDGEELSDEFKSKATNILEAAVKSNVKKILDDLAEAEKEETDEQEEIQEDNNSVTDQVDKYLNYVVEEWMEENKLSVENEVRHELTEQFITGLKTLFKESYIDIPEEKVDVVSELTTQVEKLQSELNEERKFAVNLKETLEQFTKKSIVSDVTDSLVDTEAEKIKELSESIDFVSEEDYKEKVESLKESYFPSNKKVLIDDVVEEDPIKSVNGTMGVYTSTLDRLLS